MKTDQNLALNKNEGSIPFTRYARQIASSVSDSVIRFLCVLSPYRGLNKAHWRLWRGAVNERETLGRRLRLLVNDLRSEGGAVQTRVAGDIWNVLISKYLVPVAFFFVVSTAPAAQWSGTQYNHGVNIVNTPGGFKFTLEPGDRINSVYTSRRGMAIRPVKTITMRYRIKVVSGNPRIGYVDHSGENGLPPNFRPSIRTGFLQDRYWPAGVQCAFFRVTPLNTEGILTVRCRAGLWQNVNGQIDQEGFRNTFRRDGLWVISFGGGNNFEHGINVTGGVVRFRLLEFTVR